jgi:hypothetical protein
VESNFAVGRLCSVCARTHPLRNVTVLPPASQVAGRRQWRRVEPSASSRRAGIDGLLGVSQFGTI